jgi:LmbE family N-acetylglucosaminyl deacetylase
VSTIPQHDIVSGQVLPLQSVLLIAPHADDEALGAGGLLAKLRRQHCRSHVIYACVDGMQHYGTAHRTTVQEREAEIAQVSALLGFTHSILYRDCDLIEKLDTVPQRDLVNAFETALNEHRPELLLLPHGIDFDQDHVACFRAGFAAARPIPQALGKHLPPRVVSYEMPKLTWSAEAFQPNLYIDISNELQTKLDSIEAYASQFRQPPHLRSLANIAALARVRGSECGVQYAEGFRIHRWMM